MSQRPLSSKLITQSTMSALTRAGYETVQDISTSTAEALSKNLNIPLAESRALFTSTSTSKLPLTQSAASLTTTTHKFSTHCPPVDKLLNGGLTRGHILEVSGPPGTMKEAIAVGVVRAFVERKEHVLFVRLLVLNSISFPFQTPNLNHHNRTALLDKVKQTMTKACATRSLTVVTTSQLATKVLNSDGTTGNFDTGSTAIMVPQLGPGYLPSGRTCRIIIHPETRTSGHIRVLSSPTYQPGKGSAPREPYIVVSVIVLPIARCNMPIVKRRREGV
ncbi:hypothetical protein PILCRDRAFT_82638 [Piloderma croceum F 1598]|uniref:RecA family profile 1 domain-containing protein n=1 Tax=Piloderma croceum (strain F 1598) TaxID=765440 RepID=A0A0C3ACS7_PILCF|nr:hypothetical protein PILCRDRAFT_82638 [Piloderma croceum F 1598]